MLQLSRILILKTSQTHCPQISCLRGKGVAALGLHMQLISETITVAALESRDIWYEA